MHKEASLEKDFSPEITRKPDLEKPSIGVILAIVGIDPSRNGENISRPKLWTIRERQSKNETGRVEGQISFPADTRKVEETKFNNALGSLVEFTGDDNILKNGIKFMPSSDTRRRIDVKGNMVDLAVVILDGFFGSEITPLDKDEVSANGWMSLNALKEEDPRQLRSFVEQVIKLETSDRVISNVVEDYFTKPEKRIHLSSVLPKYFSMSEFYKEREKLPDVLKPAGVIYQLKN